MNLASSPRPSPSDELRLIGQRRVVQHHAVGGSPPSGSTTRPGIGADPHIGAILAHMSIAPPEDNLQPRVPKRLAQSRLKLAHRRPFDGAHKLRYRPG